MGFNCPQCRCHFDTKPELKKNTVLDAVVDKFKVRSNTDVLSDSTGHTEPVVAPVMCDACMELKACKTCLTCMASYCEEHVRPHLENRVFAAHQLHEPLADLHDRICPDHSKLMEFFCTQHDCSICSLCLQSAHKGCNFCSTEERRALQESELKKKVFILDAKIEKTQQIVSQMKEQQCLLKDSASNRKRELEMEYGLIREMIDKDEQQAMRSVEKEEEGAQARLVTMMKKFEQNIENMREGKDVIEGLLAQTQSFAFLQAKGDLPAAVKFDPHVPRVNVDPKRSHLESAAALKEHLGHILKHPVEHRLSVLKPVIRGCIPAMAHTMVTPPLLPNPFPGPNNPINPGPPPAAKPDQKKKKTQPNKKSSTESSKEENPGKKQHISGKNVKAASKEDLRNMNAAGGQPGYTKMAFPNEDLRNINMLGGQPGYTPVLFQEHILLMHWSEPRGPETNCEHWLDPHCARNYSHHV
ncbi:hypothetical protein GJAV_G00145000 [Gymnothorax javanicus]|nr:hypothetical protein GJAV_G00145000 [Gymnothorax javanicus]